MNTFCEFVEENLLWSSGRLPETEESLAQAERALGIRIPDDLRWLLATYGYSYATGIDSLEGAVHDTLEGRLKVNLPSRFVVLKNNGYERGPSSKGSGGAFQQNGGDIFIIRLLSEGGEGAGIRFNGIRAGGETGTQRGRDGAAETALDEAGADASRNPSRLMPASSAAKPLSASPMANKPQASAKCI